MADRSEIDEVRSRTDIVSVIEQYVTLKRQGNVYKGLCPFHNEKTPSFTVRPDIGTWRCFGQCGEGGDVFKFVQKIENLSFVEALERLALRAGVTLMPYGGQSGEPGSRNQPGERERLYQVNALALRYFQERLAQAKEAQDYLCQRKLDGPAKETFLIGYAPDLWEGLVGYLYRNKAPIADAERAGLITQTERGHCDKLRGRVIFPILDVQQRPVAFGGRLIGESRPGLPKYWNSPETPLFSKSRMLYGLWRARKAIAERGCAVVVEGYTDVIAAHMAGFENVVATLGTSLTEEHVKVLGRLAPKVCLAFDADSAGLNAAYRAAKMFETREIQVAVLDLPTGEDPDSLLRAGRKDEFARCIENAVPLVAHQIMSLTRKADLDTEAGRIELFRKALPIIAGITLAIEREQYIRQMAPYHPRFASGSTFAETQIRQDVAAFRSRAGVSATTGGVRRDPAPVAGTQRRGATDVAERDLLRALISGDADLAAHVVNGVRPEEFISQQARKLVTLLYELYAADGALEPGALLDVVKEDDLLELLTSLGADDRAPLTPAVIDGNVAHLRALAIDRELARLTERINQGADPADVQEHIRLRSLRDELKAKRIAHAPVGNNVNANK
jgi:DNA primase